MRILNLGVNVADQTTLTVGGAAGGSILRITSSATGNTAVVTIPATGGVSPDLMPGNYLVTVDSEATLRSGDPLSVTIDTGATFVSAPNGEQGRTLTAWGDTSVTVNDPKDPWPRPLAASSLLPGLPDDPQFRQLLLTLADATPIYELGKSGDGPAPALHALLIGIDAYDPGPGQETTIYRSLGGAVRDVTEVEQFLVAKAKVPPARIKKLISPRTPDGSPRPTYENIVRTWRALIDEAQPGDVVYIHYSGHGGRAATLLPAIKPSKLDEVLAPCDVNDRTHGRYLRDFEIAALLAQMSRKGLLTTFVIDACHSGSAAKGGQAQARRGDIVDQVPRDALATSLVAPAAELEAIARELERNPRGLEVTWAVGADRETQLTTVIAACRQSQAAYEYPVDGIHRQGALTYYWLQALGQGHAGMTYRDAYHQVFAHVHATFEQQSPVLLGAGNRLVLGTATLAQPASIPVLAVDGERITLGAGTAALIEPGTHLAVIPREFLPELVELSAMAQVEVTSSGATSATARIVAPAPQGSRPIAVGAQAVVVTYAPRLTRTVQLLPSAEASDAPTRLAAVLAADSSKLLTVAAPTRSLAADPAVADFQISIDRSMASGALIYAVLDPSGAPIPNLLPEIPIDAPNAAERVRDRLVHLTRYRNVQMLINSDANATLANKLEVSLHADRGGVADPAPLPEQPTFALGQHFWLRVKNRSLRDLIISALDLDADWSISPLGEPWELDPGKERLIQLVADLPKGRTRGTDILKVIATRELPNLDWLAMPSLDQAEREAPQVSRRAPAGPFEALLKSMQAPERPGRTARVASVPTRDWTEAQVMFEVVRDKDCL